MSGLLLGCFGGRERVYSGTLPLLLEPVDYIDENSCFARILGIYNCCTAENQKTYVVFNLKDRSKNVLVEIDSLKKAGLTNSAINRIRNLEESDRLEGLRAALLVENVSEEDFRPTERSYLLTRSISPWEQLSESLSFHIKALHVDQNSEEKVRFFFNKVMDLQKSQVFSIIPISSDLKKAIVVGRRGVRGDIFIISKNLNYKPIGEGGFAEVRKSDVTELSNTGSRISDQSIALKLFKENIQYQSALEKKGHQNVQNIDEAIIEYFGEIVDSRMESLDSQGLVFPAFWGDMFMYLEKFFEVYPALCVEERLGFFSDLFKKISRALEKMHERGYVHNDIKDGNILVNCKEDLKISKVVISDFTSTSLNEKSGDITVDPEFTFLNDYKIARGGSPDYADARKRIDVRQFAFFMFRLLSTYQTKDGLYDYSPYKEVNIWKNRNWPNPNGFYRDLPRSIPKDFRDLIKDMLSPDSTKVPSMKDVCVRLKAIL